MKRVYMTARAKLGVALLAATTASMGLFAIGAAMNDSNAFNYLLWNLFLAWVPFIIVLWLERTLQRKLWSSWQALILTLLWLVFLPNSFYLITDYVHVQELERVDLLYDIVMFTSFIFNGIILGFLSLYIVHWELLKRVGMRLSGAFISCVLLLSSFAIYIGRELRWNTWDIAVNPASLLFDVSDRLLNASEHPQALTTTFGFFVLLGSIYIVIWFVVRNARQLRSSD